MSNMDLVEFLTARLDEDGQVARAAFSRLASTEGQWHAAGMQVRDGRDHLIVKHSWPAEIEHIARHDPARVLAEVEAKREILDEHERQEPVRPLIGPQCCRCVKEMHGWQEDWSAQEYPCRTLRLLASVYADHPDYSEGWKL